ncbi:MAG: hypothetical protein FWG75_06145 [Cystobacterineae bacterium]|nr:hypothetical protein [Cystobacterineae bacterium]
MASGPQAIKLPIGKSLLGVAVLGACLGVGLAWMERRSDEEKLESILQAPEALSPVLFPEAPPAPLEEETESPPPLPVAMQGLPVYPGSTPQSFHSTVLADGKPVEMAWFSTTDTPAQLRAFYEKEFKLRGLHHVSHEYSPFAGYMGYMDWFEEELHLVSYIRQGEQTMVFPSRSRPASEVEGEQLPEEVPVHPRASVAKTIIFVEPEGQSRLSYSALVENHSLLEVKQFYKEALLAKGWKNIQEKEEGGRSNLEASNERMVANFSFEPKQNNVGIYLLLMGKAPEK